jgi:cyclic-di-GMP-binding protein
MLNNLRTLFGKREADPLSTLKTATQWTDKLPMGNAQSAQEAIVRKLEEFNRRKPALTLENIQIVMHLDDHAQDLQHTLCDQYLRNPRMSRIMESQLWNMIHSFYWETTRAYHGFIMEFVASPGGNKLEDLIPLIAARALDGFGNIFKWRDMRYELPEERLWLRLHNLYRVAEYEHFQDTPLELHAGEQATTCSRLYVSTLMLNTLNIDTLYPRQVDLVSRWLRNWSADIRPDNTLNTEQHHFYVDTTQGAGMRRVRGSTGKESCRYWSTHALERKILHAISELKNGAPPAKLGLTEDCRLHEAFELLEKILRQWSSNYVRNQRRAARSSVKMRLSVLRNLTDLAQMLYRQQRAAQPRSEIVPDKWEVQVYKLGGIGKVPSAQSPTISEASEHWVVEDESSRGYCAHLEINSDDWLQLGQIIGVKAERGGSWQPAVVRRMRRLPENMLEVGLELLPGMAHSLMLRSRQREASGYYVNGVDSMASPPPVPGILLEPEPTIPERESLILDSAHYGKGRVYDFTLHDEDETVQLDAILDKGPGWVRAVFAKMQ